MKLLIVCLLCVGCAAEWDYPKVPQRNPNTGKMESKYVYFPPKHPMPPVQINTRSK